MFEKMLIVIFFLCTLFVLFGIARTEVIARELRSTIALQKVQIEELQKKMRVVQSDINFVEFLVSEGQDDN